MLKIRFMIICIALIASGCRTTHFISMDENIIAPKLIDKPLFIYPHIAQKNSITGKVYLIIKIDKTGKVESVMLEKTSGHGILDKSAMAFVKQFKYKPAELNGQPIQVHIKQSVDYFLSEETGLAKTYVKRVKELKKKIEEASPDKQSELQKELLAVYTDFINSNLDFIVFNQKIREVVNTDSYTRWNETTNDWPLHFIVFDDFQKSYPNSSVNNDARKLMFEYLKKDYDAVNVISTFDNDFLYKREKFNKKLNLFLNEEYTGLLPDSLNYLIQ